MQPLPIDPQIPGILTKLAAFQALVLIAPPGSGKSTRVPPALAKTRGKTFVLQPRRVAARSLAKRIAGEQGWQVGKEVGWRVRFERVGGDETKLWVMTEGSLTKQLQSDPYLDGVSTVVLDEFHERSLHTDLSLAWLAELKRTVRPDLALVVMSATMDPKPVAKFLGDCPVVDVDCPRFPVAIEYAQGDDQAPLPNRVARAVSNALEKSATGDILVFLPGVGEIRAAEFAIEAIARDANALVLPLHGSLPPDQQDAALAPAERRKIVLATNVAETSITIPGVTVVIDSGLARVARFNPDSGLDELILENVSKYSTTQRAGRAGRTAPGTCVRLWSRLQENRMAESGAPEIARVDLAPTLLTLKGWHGPDPRKFPWFEPPSEERLQAGEDLLALLAACDAPYAAINERGKRMARLPVHPRLAGLILEAEKSGARAFGATVAALIGERDLLMPRRRGDPPATPDVADALGRIEALETARRADFRPHLRDQGIDPIAAREIMRVREELIAMSGGPERKSSDVEAPKLIPRLLLAAYPDRVAKRAAPTANRAAMVGGVSVEIDNGSCLFALPGHPRRDLLLCAVVQGLGNRARTSIMVRQACEITEDDITAVFPGSIQRRELLSYDAQRQVVNQAVAWYYRDLSLRMAHDAKADPAAVSACLANALRPEATNLIHADETAGNWLSRCAWLATAMPELKLPAFTDVDFATLIDELCAGCRARAEVLAKPKLPWLESRLSYEQQRAVAEYAPADLLVPSGSRIKLAYQDSGAPILAVRLQELFGLNETPRLASGRVPVLLHLLGPNYRPEQVTSDLASFWKNTYPQVRKDLRNRYPKHSWPEDPLSAPAVAKGRHRPPP